MLIVRQILLVLLLCAAGVWAQSGTGPQIGYLYPAGGQQGTVVTITVGGQLLRGAREVYVSGEGIEASVVEFMRPPTNINKDVRDLLQARLKEVRDTRIAELEGKTANPAKEENPDEPAKEKDASKETVRMPQHPLLHDLDSKSLRELAHITNVIFMPRTKLQMNRQLAEMVLVRVKISADAEPGRHELRIVTANGVSNPMVFDVGSAPERQELEPNDRQAYPPIPNLPNGVKTPEEKAVEIPAVFNGQIMPGDVDRFRFRADKGRQLVIHAQARSLIPYLADAVPGWFQATLALYDAKGNEVAYADDYQFDPDPVLFYQIPEDGEYELQIRDSLYRGREDFVYRVSVGEDPFITGMFPLGAKAGEKTVASVEGLNLPLSRLNLDTEGDQTGMRQTVYRQGKRVSNPVLYEVGDLPECGEEESNNTLSQAQEIKLPKIINGRIDKEGDIDVYRFSGTAGETVVAEVYARRLNSPLDSLVRLTDSSASVVAWNDDFEVQQDHLYEDERGLVTHHADSYLSAKLPKDGTYCVYLRDAQNHGGRSYGYRLRISRPMPDFALRITPSSLSVRAGAIVPVCAYVLRKDGFDGDIEIVAGEASKGFKVSGGLVPSGCDRICITVEAPAKAPDKPVPLELVGRAKVGEQTISRRAVAADDTMQAFLYRHLVCADELLVNVIESKYRVPEIRLAEQGRVEIPAGGTVEITFKSTGSALQRMKVEMRDPPEGLALAGTSAVAGGLKLHLKADKDITKSGLEANLLFEGFNEYTPKPTANQAAPKKARSSAGYLPAVPIRIVEGKAQQTGA